MPEPNLAGPSDLRPLPVSVPINVRKTLETILADPKLSEKTIAFVITPTVHNGPDGMDLRLRMAAMVQLGKGSGWSFGGFTEWQPLNNDISAGLELRFAR